MIKNYQITIMRILRKIKLTRAVRFRRVDPARRFGEQQISFPHENIHDPWNVNDKTGPK
jgi:hypothetical protein